VAPPDDEPELLEEVDDDELLLEDELELEELLELELEELDEPPPEPSPVQIGATKLPSWLPCTPNTLVAVWPGAGNCQPQQLLN
jgi:hypothetical protein